MTQTKIVNVAAGVLMRPDGHVLLAQRPAGKPYEGWWEFPGGKFEPGENAEIAVTRELEEELGIRVQASSPWVVREHVYEHAHVRLYFRRITAWEGEPRGREGQALAWCALDTVNLEPLLPASVDLIRWLQLPPVYAISNAAALGVDAWLERLTQWLEQRALPVSATGANVGALLQWANATLGPLLLLREPDLPADTFQHLLTETLARAEGHGVRVMLSSRHPEQSVRLAAERTGGGLHLTGADLRALVVAGRLALSGLTRPVPSHAHPAQAGEVPQTGRLAQEKAMVPAGRPASPVRHVDDERALLAACGWAGRASAASLRRDYPLLAASCHNTEDLRHAGNLQLDFSVCSPVLPTLSHPGEPVMGWDGLARMLSLTPIPVYALGGMKPSHLPDALQAGAQGVAMQRGVW